MPARISIVQLLKERPLCVGALARFLGLTPGAVSQHLRLLRDVGLVVPTRRGYFIHYRLNPEVLAQWQAALQSLLAADFSADGQRFMPEGEELGATVTKTVKNPTS